MLPPAALAIIADLVRAAPPLTPEQLSCWRPVIVPAAPAAQAPAA